jgi:NSS family neurotransmitter:Na+ symporter
MMAEILIGRRGRRNPVATMALLGEEECSSRRWRLVGMLGVVCGVLILSYYSVIAGWALAYVLKGASGIFTGADAAGVGAEFTGLAGSWASTGFWHTVLMPALLGLLLVLLGYSMVAGDFAAGWDFMFAPRFSELTRDGALIALGHSFFTLSVGMGAVMAYGAYLPDEHSIGKTSMAIVAADTAIAILAGLVIFPIVFANGLDPATGPGLIFQSLPLAFGQLPGGQIVAATFFLLLTFAAWTSAISIMEPGVAWLIETLKLSRPTAAWSIGSLIWLVGILNVLSFNVIADVTFLRGTVFDNLDFLTSNILLPLGGLAIIVFAGWIMSRNSTADEIDPAAGLGYRGWRFLARYIAPVAVVLIFLNAIGLF